MSARSRIIVVGGDYKDPDSLGSSTVRERGKMWSRLALPYAP
ncbi:MAG: hypothetical protein WB683_10455 [Candidatus Sulfotelmatobacter sp.]